MTLGDVLKSSIVFSLTRVKVQIGARFYNLGLTPKMVDEIATKAITAMRQRGRWKELDEEIQSTKTGDR